MMKWSRLQLNTLPLIAIEADKAIEKLEQLITKVNLNAKYQDIEDLNNLRKSIMDQINALDRFYELHYLDSTIAIFHMIKIKLKRAIFRVDNINNESMSIQFLNNQSRVNEIENIKKTSFSRVKKQKSITKKPNDSKQQLKDRNISTSNSKLKLRERERSKDNILKLLQTSRRQQENDTNLMEESHHFRQRERMPTFYEDQQFQFYEPLFKTEKKNVNVPKLNIKEANQKLKESASPFSKSPFNKSPFNKSPLNKKHQNTSKFKTTNNKNEQMKQPINTNQVKGKTNGTGVQQKKPAVHSQKQESNKKTNEKSTKLIKPETNKYTKTKKQSEQIRINEEAQSEDMSEFRFTIKMSKQEYINLLKLKEVMKNNTKMS